MARIEVQIPLTVFLPPQVDRLIREAFQPDAVAKLFPNTIRRLGELGQVGVTLWRERAVQIPGAEGRPLRLGPPMVRLNRQEYANSIALQPAEVIRDGLSAEIATADPQAKTIEEGGTLIDLHAILAYAPKARQSKAGKKYLYIPFRHATTAPGGPGGQRFQATSAKWGSNVLPPNVLAVMQTKKPSQIVGSYFERGPNIRGGMVQRFLYSRRPGRLTLQELTQLGYSAQSIEARKLTGLFRTGRAGHGAYLTIRTLSEANDKGWRIPPYQAQQLAHKTAADLRALGSDWFDGALKADAALWAAAVGAEG